MSGYETLIHTHGDLVIVMGTDGQVRGYEVEADGSLTEIDPARAIAIHSERKAR